MIVCANPACNKPWKNGTRQCLCAWQGMALWREVETKKTKRKQKGKRRG